MIKKCEKNNENVLTSEFDYAIMVSPRAEARKEKEIQKWKKS